ncbi:MAG TPA: hypothetical protein VMY35_11410 [Phycisphaerae bacterium]|nr:hypothetical protein [Phycisphaerae bacterium]
MAIEDVYQGDIGTVITINFEDDGVALSLAGATTCELYTLRPSGARGKWTLTVTGDGTAGVATYTTVAGDLDVEGDWRVQGHLINASGNWVTNEDVLRVHRRLGA